MAGLISSRVGRSNEGEGAESLHLSNVLLLIERGNDESRGISDGALKAFLKRRLLSLSLKDTITAVNILYYVLLAGLAVVISVISLLIVQEAFVIIYITSSSLLLVTYFCGYFAKSMLESIFFVSILHPYDVGDRVEIYGVEMVVKKMNLHVTVFIRQDNNHKMFYANRFPPTLISEHHTNTVREHGEAY